MVRGVVLAVVLTEMALEGGAWADDRLAQARMAIDESDYLAARSELATVRDAGGCSPGETAELYLLSGRVEAALGEPQAATDAFSHLLALSPTAALPPGMSPRITGPFDAAVAALALQRPLELEVETRATPPVITVAVVSDPMRMVEALRVVYAIDGGPERTVDVAASQRAEIPLGAGARIAARVAALDAHGNRLTEIGAKTPIVIVAEAAPVPVRPAAPVRVHRAGRPVYLRWWPYAAAAVAFGGATAYFGWSAYAAASDLRDLNSDSVHRSWREAGALRDRGERDTLLTNIGLVATGACALTAGVMFAIQPSRAETRVTAAPLPGGAAVTVLGRF